MKTRRRLSGTLALIVGLAAAAAACGRAQAPAAFRPLDILITNDDGIEDPGIKALAEAFGPLGRVTVAAPVSQRSGASHGVTSDRSIAVKESEQAGQRWIAIDALPATCVRLAIEELLPARPDLVLSGINRGENLGTVTFYSATVAAAREAAFQGLPAIAVNLAAGKDRDNRAAAAVAAAIVKAIGPEGIARGTYLNINVPALPMERLRGIRLTRQDTRAPIDRFARAVSPEGLVDYTPSWSHLEPAGEGTDIWAVRNGYVSVSVFGFDQSAAVPPGVFTSLQRLESLPIK